MVFVIISEFLFLAWGKELVPKTNCNLRGRISSFRFNPVKILPMVVLKEEKERKCLRVSNYLRKRALFSITNFLLLVLVHWKIQLDLSSCAF